MKNKNKILTKRKEISKIHNHELKILEYLTLAKNIFISLPMKHPSQRFEFCKAIHDAQKIIMWRLAQRNYPEIFAIYEDTHNINDSPNKVFGYVYDIQTTEHARRLSCRRKKQ